MKKITIAEFRRNPGRILKLAEQENIQITVRGKAKFILTTVEAERALRELRKKIKVHSTNPEDYEIWDDEIWEDYFDVKAAEIRRHEPTVSLDELKQRVGLAEKKASDHIEEPDDSGS